jgi:hypothetical protein
VNPLEFAKRYKRTCAVQDRAWQEERCRVIAQAAYGRPPRDLGELENAFVVGRDRQFHGPAIYGPFSTFFSHLERPPDPPPFDPPEPWRPDKD